MKVFNKGNGPQPKTKRDENLIKDYKRAKRDNFKTISMSDLVGKYRISNTRIRQLLNRNGVK